MFNPIRKYKFGVASVVLLAASAAVQAATPTCNGLPATKVITSLSQLSPGSSPLNVVPAIGYYYLLGTMDRTGVVTTIAGADTYDQYIDGPGIDARFTGLGEGGMVADNLGNLYIADTGNHVVRKLSLQTNQVTTVVGTRNAVGFQPGPTPGVLANPLYLAISGNTLYITMDHAIVQVTPLP
jgi:hypothetical protein